MNQMETIHLGGRLHRPVNEIEFLVADENYTKIFFVDGSKATVATTLGKLWNRLPPKTFVRPNRSLILKISNISYSNQNQLFCPLLGVVKISRRRNKEVAGCFD
jgi:DNA-binding LytR/AlgR family response regulator